MDQGRVLLRSVALSGAALLATPDLRAEGPSIVARLDYEAPASCPEAATFERLVKGRTQRVTFAEAGESTRFIVRVRRTNDGFSATLTRRETTGEALAGRQVSGADCATVVDALALTAALSVDPDALLGGKPSESGQSETGTSDNPPKNNGTKPGESTERGKPSETDKPSESGKSEKPEGTEETEEPEEPEGPEAPRGPARFVVGAFGSYAYWVKPGGMLLARVTLGMSADLPLPVALEISGAFGSSQPLGAIDQADFELLAVAPRVCIGRLGERDLVSIRPCFSFLMGQLSGEGQDIATPSSTKRSIFAPGVALVLGGPITAGLSWQLEGGLSIPLVSRRFFVGGPANVVGETPAIAPEVVAGATYAF